MSSITKHLTLVGIVVAFSSGAHIGGGNYSKSNHCVLTSLTTSNIILNSLINRLHYVDHN